MKQEQPRILLIEPPFYRLYKDTYSLAIYPLSLGYLAGAIKKDTSWSVMAYNADFSPRYEKIMRESYLTGAGFDNYLSNLKNKSGPIWKAIKSTIAEYNPTVVGISAKSQNFASAHIVAQIAKEINERTIVIMGGPHPSMVGSNLLVYPEIDICVKGEGENTIVELLDAIEHQRTFEGIQGIAYRRGGNIVENAPREPISNLDSLCFPHENAPEVLKDYDQYPPTAFSHIFAIRGCPFNCFFCGSRNIWARKVRFRSPENVVEEIKALQRKGIRYIRFDDDIFGTSKQYLDSLCTGLIAHCPKLKWDCELHVKLINTQTIPLMKEAGCWQIQIGIESGNNEMLKKIRKHITIEEALSACKLVKEHGINVSAFFIVGFPWETEDTLNDTFTAMKLVECDSLVYSIFTPYPGTEAFELCKEKGLIDDNYDFSLYNHQSPANSFCINISPQRFRVLCLKIEKMVESKNRRDILKLVFSPSVFSRIRDNGIFRSLEIGRRILFGK